MTTRFLSRRLMTAAGVVTLISTLALGGCGRKDDAPQESVATESQPATQAEPELEVALETGSTTDRVQPAAGESAAVPAESAAPPGAAKASSGAAPAASITITAADVDAYRRGQSAEIAHAESLMSDLMSAPDLAQGREVLEQMQDAPARHVAGASAAGMELDRYLEVSASIEDVLKRWRRANMVSHVLADTSMIASMPPDKQARARASLAQAADPYAGVPAATVDLVVPQLESLDSLHVIPGAIVQQAQMLVRNAENKEK